MPIEGMTPLHHGLAYIPHISTYIPQVGKGTCPSVPAERATMSAQVSNLMDGETHIEQPLDGASPSI